MNNLERLYGTVTGRAVLSILVRPALSRAAGRYLDSGISRRHIQKFVEKNRIDLSQYAGAPYRSFNAFFTREIQPRMRTFDFAPEALCSPCDARLMAYSLTTDAAFTVKNVVYTLPTLLRDKQLAASFAGGTALVFRLCVDDYHRYCWFDSGKPMPSVRIPGVLHTVRPVATERVPVFCENSREFSVVQTASFGTAVQMEVGALMVGKITNHPVPESVRRGQEKGYFEFGGSTIIVLLKPGAADLREDISAASARGEETRVLQGERVGAAILRNN